LKKLLNTLYITSPDMYLSLDGENVVALREPERPARVPLHNLEGIVTLGYTGVSPALMGSCADRGISLTFLTASGRFLANVSGLTNGGAVLRRIQYRRSDNETESLPFARNILTGKLHNSRWVLERAVRDHPERVDVEKLTNASRSIAGSIPLIRKAGSSGELFGIEGEAANRYFSAFDELILQNKDHFSFVSRNRRPPTDNVNAMLSFTYTLLVSEITAALCSAGLDPFAGFLHKDRPGRRSLALDVLEELRAPLADRFVISLINTRQIEPSGFFKKESGAVVMKDDTRKDFITEWQKRKKEKLTHPFLNEKIEWGLVAHAQALLLARTLRGDLDEYPPFLWK